MNKFFMIGAVTGWLLLSMIYGRLLPALWNVSIRMRQISFSVKPLFCPDLAC